MEKEECIALEIEMKKATIWKEKRAEWKVETHSKENKKYLQQEINKLARMIDAKFNYPCIDCCGRSYGKQIDGAHFHSVGSNSTLRYNLHNIHSADSQCNNFSNTHISGYKNGLTLRYGKEYLQMLYEIPVAYDHLKLTNVEIAEKLKIVRSIIRTFDTYSLVDGKSARELFNKLIGIYK